MKWIKQLFKQEVTEPHIPWFDPPLVLQLVEKEREKGAVLSRKEVQEITDQAVADQISIPISKASQMIAARGYGDINPFCAYDDWMTLRGHFIIKD